jgi:hypothetical protein
MQVPSPASRHPTVESNQEHAADIYPELRNRGRERRFHTNISAKDILRDWHLAEGSVAEAFLRVFLHFGTPVALIVIVKDRCSAISDIQRAISCGKHSVMRLRCV